MKKIELTQGKYALVDDHDYKFLMQWKWCAAKSGNTYYAIRACRINGKRTTIRMHRVIAERMCLDLSHEIDHKGRNGLNNQRYNIRDSTGKQNQENRGLNKNNKSGVKGVDFHKASDMWRATIRHNGKLIHLGLFDRLKDAVAARLAGERKYFTHA